MSLVVGGDRTRLAHLLPKCECFTKKNIVASNIFAGMVRDFKKSTQKMLHDVVFWKIYGIIFLL